MKFPFAKKSLGQNFLNSKKVLVDILKSADVKDNDEVLEIGPGRGVLTSELLKAGAKVIAVEKDRELVRLLTENFEKEIEEGRLRLIEGDILETDLDLPKEYKLIANIPYYITGQIFRMFLEGYNVRHCTMSNIVTIVTIVKQPMSMTLLVQKEVADRIMTRDNKESILSLSVKAYGTPKYITTVKPGSFTPSPNVDSAVLHIQNISKDFFTTNSIDEKLFFKIIKSAFAHKRKMIAKNLSDVGYVIPDKIDKRSRAEDLKLNDFMEITKANLYTATS